MNRLSVLLSCSKQQGTVRTHCRERNKNFPTAVRRTRQLLLAVENLQWISLISVIMQIISYICNLQCYQFHLSGTVTGTATGQATGKSSLKDKVTCSGIINCPTYHNGIVRVHITTLYPYISFYTVLFLTFWWYSSRIPALNWLFCFAYGTR